MSYPGCLTSECWDFHTFFQNCTGTPGGTVKVTQAIETCLCASSSLTAYTTCYPCLIESGMSNVIGPATFAAGCDTAVSPLVSAYVYFPVITTSSAVPTSTSTPTSSGSGSDGNSNGGGSGSSNHTAMYAGIGAGVAVLVLGMALFFYFRNKNSKSHNNSSKTTKEDIPGPLPAMQPVQQTQYLPPQPPQQPPPQQHLFAQQPVASPVPQQTFDQAMQQQQQQQQLFMQQPTQVSTSGYYQTPAPVVTNSQQQYYQHQQGQQAMTFHQPITSENVAPIATTAAATAYMPPPMPMPVPAQPTYYAVASPTPTALQTPAMSSPTLIDESSTWSPEVSTRGPQGPVVASKDPQFVDDGMQTLNATAYPPPVNNPQQYFSSPYHQ